MGNISMQHLQPAHAQQWAHSYPRAAQNKVLPERVPGQRLRVTDNGAILHNGGTISGRRPVTYSDEDTLCEPIERYRSRSSSNHRHQGPQNQSKRFGSEPDLRNPSPAKQRISRTRKKYKAPPPPPEGESYGPDSSSPDSYHWENLDPPARRLRLFKTREETKRGALPKNLSAESPKQARHEGSRRTASKEKRSIPVGKEANRRVPNVKDHDPLILHIREPDRPALNGRQHDRPALNVREHDRPALNSREHNRPALNSREHNRPALNSREHNRPALNGREYEWFVDQDERNVESGRQLSDRGMRVNAEKCLIDSPAIPRISGHRSAANRSLSTPEFQAELQRAAQRLRTAPPVPAPREVRGDGSGRESTPEPQLLHNNWDILRPTKTFYFGMEQGDRDAVDRFAASIHRLPTTATTSGSGGSLSSDMEEELDGCIALQLRPMLPKKQLEIPRFSPTAAWRLLTGAESPVVPVEESPVWFEDRIQRLSRPMAPPQAPSHDKSGDSGISGDASPGGLHENAAAWTPQQDLESSSDGDVDESMHAAGPQPKFSPRTPVFSLSLPRDERLCLALYSENKNKTSFNSLKKLKRSVSGAFTALNIPTKMKDDDRLLDENWLLSRSVANSLNSGHVKPHSTSSNNSTPDHNQSQHTSFSYLASGGHVMYLPEYKSRQEQMPVRVPLRTAKSCENISASEMRQLGRTPSPDVEPLRAEDIPESPSGKKGKNQRFTFQSTVRQIERRRISERLSREAELEEQRRLGELEAMRRVEAEFQRKRAPEKANIRHQLRLFNLDEQQFSSLPTGWTDTARAEPDGAAMPDPRPLSTQVLSEFREPRRDYRDYRPPRLLDEPQLEKRATVHPSAVFDMPKTKPVIVAPQRGDDRGSSSSDNYRRDFAHGALRSLSTDSEPSRPTSRQQSRSSSPAPRQRSSCHSDDDPNNQVSSDVAKQVSLTSVQPFMLKSKAYRPIAFNLGANPTQIVAQIVI